ncbi:KpsF/GutQ family sugar-phosphate isomerase [Sphingomonas elodea]|uniref:KpsF/GutQ family sugar-phosphate isomerase n=1 Tax=Sphingomonas elodea TaxID=179878 RepID=UPI00026312CC|nr:KpsF/GutQ family sugar-phosphate isomerase [Sphingomonas elodea]
MKLGAIVRAPDAPPAAALAWAGEVIAAERRALQAFEAVLPPSLADAVAAIAGQASPLTCLGMGKSGLIAAKVAATFSSLGTPAFALNAGEAAHGDLGAVQDGNVVLLFSNSGTTDEIARILPLLKARACLLIGVVGRPDSPLGRAVDILIPAITAGEADHIGMAPTCSTTLQLAIGDALAVAVSRSRGFTRTDFLRHHPAGLLGRQSIPLRTLMRTGDELPKVGPDAPVADLLAAMSAGRMGAACVVDADQHLLGLVVDGDVRRHFQSRRDVYDTPAATLMQPHPQVIDVTATLGDALLLLREHAGGFLVLPVVDGEGRLHGMLHAKDMMNG